MLKIGYYGLCVLFISLYSTHVNGYRLNTCVSQYPRFKSQIFMKIDDKQESKFSSFFGINRMSSSLLIAGAMLTNTFLPFSPFSNSNNLQAKTLSNLQQASILFQKSDDAYKLTENQYVKMENELKKTNQLIEKTILNKYKTVASKLNQYDKEFSALILRYNKLLADNDAIILTKYQAEINELEKLVEVKYAAAEKALESLNEAPKTSNKAPATPSSTSSSSTNNGPQKFTGYKGNPNNNNPNNRLLATSELFNKAKTEAMRLEENKKQYQLISDSIQSNQKINQQLNDYFIKTSSHYHSQIINLLNKIINHNRDEYYNFNNGIGINENICRYQLNDCILHGKEGLSNVQTAIDKYQENENDVLKYLTIVENEIRTYNDLKKEFQQSILTRLSTQLQSINQWEEMNKLALTKNKNLLLHYETELNTIFNALDKKYTTFIHDIEYGLASPTGNADYFNKNNNKNNKNNGNILNLMTSNTKQSYESVIKSMKVVLENLEIADKTSKTAEKLLLEAKEQGDKEASVYLKSRALNGVPSSTNPATTTNNAPTTSTQTIVVKEVKVVKK